MAFNLMCEGCEPNGYEFWPARVPYLGDTIMRYDPDLVGLQEMLTAEHVADLLAATEGYSAIYFTAPTPDDIDYADATIFYRSSLFEEVERGFYWLSPTPDIPYSNGFVVPQFPRLVTWARLRTIDAGHEFIFATTHFDNNKPSQDMSAPLVLERTAALASEVPVVMVGDFNSRPASTAYATLTSPTDNGSPYFSDAFVLAGDWSTETNLDPAPSYEPADLIDHVFVAGGPWQAEAWTADQWGYGPTEQYTSDHFAISVRIWTP